MNTTIREILCRPVLCGMYILLSLTLLVSCGDSEYEYSSHKCYFIFDNSQHLDPTLSSALVPLSPGTFCRIYKKGDNYFYFESNQGLSSRSAANAVDQKRTCILGVYNESGIIVGYGTLGESGNLYAYDAQCPNCYEETGLPRYTLSMNDAGKASCGKCKRTYDMNNGGIITGGGNKNDRKMIRYRAQYREERRILTVNN